MIQVVGSEGTSEFTAAQNLAERIVQAWPSVADDPAHDVRLIAGAKCHGQRVRDIDILLLATFGPGVQFQPFLSFTDQQGHLQTPKTVQVDSLCVAIEVKDHSEHSVRFVGTAVEVPYENRWHNASEQNEKQKYSVLGYLAHHRLPAPWVTAILWLPNVPMAALPPRPHSTVGAPLTWEYFLNVVAQISPPKLRGKQWVLSAADQRPIDLTRAADLFTKVLTPTRLDRQRVERLTRRVADLAQIRADVGTRLVILRGRGGTGKTMRLLQLASQLADEEGSRVLILTYNKALVADIRRLLTIVGIGDDIVGSTIQVQTVHSFLHAALSALEFDVQEHTDFFVDYERRKDEALSYLRSGVLSPADIELQAAAGVEAFQWDYIFVDEGRDWPNNERDVLLHLYKPGNVAVADGIDQLVRSTVPIDWRAGLKRGETRVVALKTSLRMKAGLARFVSAVARHLGLPNSEWEANEELAGGRVIVVDRPYLSHRALHDRLVQDTKDDENAPIDMLFCVPPSLVVHGKDESYSLAARVFEQWGYHTWDGAVEDVREGYPTEIDQLRVVQYESCRGLEGWTVVNLAVDTFYEHKLAQARTAATSNMAAMPGVFAGDPTHARQQAARWFLIPLTRAIDTLVLQLEREHSPVRAALVAAAQECGDYVEWLSG